MFIPIEMLAEEDGCSQTLLRLPESDSANKILNDVMNRERGTRISFRLLVKHPSRLLLETHLGNVYEPGDKCCLN